MSLLHTALLNNLTLDPDDYLTEKGTSTPALEKKFQTDKAKLEKFVYIYSFGSAAVKGAKECPRIVLNLQGYYPGRIGIERYMLDKEDKANPKVIEFSDILNKEIMIDVHLVANNQHDLRLLHSIMYKALPAAGYIKPYINNKEEWKRTKLLPAENIYIEVGNYYQHDDPDHGILEKVYTYSVSDGVVIEVGANENIVPIRDISMVIAPENAEETLIRLTTDNAYRDKDGIHMAGKKGKLLYGK